MMQRTCRRLEKKYKEMAVQSENERLHADQYKEQVIFMPPKELWEAYSNRTVRPSVHVSVPLSCPVHISFIL